MFVRHSVVTVEHSGRRSSIILTLFIFIYFCDLKKASYLLEIVDLFSNNCAFISIMK